MARIADAKDNMLSGAHKAKTKPEARRPGAKVRERGQRSGEEEVCVTPWSGRMTPPSSRSHTQQFG